MIWYNSLLECLVSSWNNISQYSVSTKGWWTGQQVHLCGPCEVQRWSGVSQSRLQGSEGGVWMGDTGSKWIYPILDHLLLWPQRPALWRWSGKSKIQCLPASRQEMDQRSWCHQVQQTHYHIERFLTQNRQLTTISGEMWGEANQWQSSVKCRGRWRVHGGEETSNQ